MQVASERENAPNDDFSTLSIPGVLDFEGGEGDNTVGDNVRDKRTPRFIFRTVSCLFTFLINPSCLQGITGGGSGGGGSGDSLSSYGSNRRQQQQQSQPYYMISLPRYNDTDNSTGTEYPIYPIESTSEYYPEEPVTSRPTNPLLAMIQWKMNLIPNLIRRFFPGFGGGRRDDGSSSSGFGGGLGNFNLFGRGRGLSSLFGGGNQGGGLGGFGGLGGLGGGLGQY